MQKNFNLAWRNPSNKPQDKYHDVTRVFKSSLIKKIINSYNNLQQMSVVIRLSSNVIKDLNLLYNFAENLEILSISNIKITVIHGYIDLIDEHIHHFISSNDKQLLQFGNNKISDLLEMVISGHINRHIVTKLCLAGVQALGFSGKDGNLIMSGKNIYNLNILPEINICEPQRINPELLFELEETRIVPVISPVAINEKGRTTLLDADYTAAMIASSINANRLVIMCENVYLINEVKSLSSIKELNELLDNNILFDLSDQMVGALKYILVNSEITVYFVDSNDNNSLLISMFDL